jgi:chemotaxis protein methyltransferase CheR
MTVETELGGQRLLAAREFAWLQRFLFERTGIELRHGKEPMVMGRLDRRLRHHGMSSYEEYVRFLETGDPSEVQVAVDLLTTNETYFFREPQHFDFLRDVFSERRASVEFIRVWSAASSSGEEAYSIAMVLASTLPERQGWEVVGTDVSTRMVETARQSLYPIEASEKIPREYLHRFCLRGREEYEGFLAIDGLLRSHVTFREVNLTALPDDLGHFDVIFLRNVMIYFGMETKRKLAGEIVDMLRPGGYLLVSHSETLNGMHRDLRLLRPSIYCRNDGRG